jgi:hypothetical protein
MRVAPVVTGRGASRGEIRCRSAGAIAIKRIWNGPFLRGHPASCCYPERNHCQRIFSIMLA